MSLSQKKEAHAKWLSLWERLKTTFKKEFSVDLPTTVAAPSTEAEGTSIEAVINEHIDDVNGLNNDGADDMDDGADGEEGTTPPAEPDPTKVAAAKASKAKYAALVKKVVEAGAAYVAMLKSRDQAKRPPKFVDNDVPDPSKTVQNGVLVLPDGWYVTAAGICRSYTEMEAEIAKIARYKQYLVKQRALNKYCCLSKKRGWTRTCA